MALAEGVGSKWMVGLDGRGYMVTTLDQESPFEYRAFTQQAVPLRTPRIDTSPEPGEASLGDLWVRSQHDWSEGMGQRIFDGINSSRLRSDRIGGFDPFIVAGKLIPTPGIGSSAIGAKGPAIASGDAVYFFDGTSLHRYNEALTTESETITARYSGEPFGSPHNIAADGQFIYYATASGIFKILTTDAFGAWSETEVKLNDLTNCTVVEWAKGRLIACRENDVHVINDITEVADGAVPHYSNLDQSWLWTDVDDLGHGIYLAGYSDADSKLYLMGFDTTDAQAGLTIGVPKEVWRASAGEKILSIAPYAGSAMLLGTNKGVRNCNIVDRDGNVTVGPLIESGGDVEVWDIGIWGKYAFFFYGEVAGWYQRPSRVAKLDLSTFAFAGVFETDSTYVTQHGVSIVIPSWYKEWQSPMVTITEDGTTFRTSYHDNNPSGQVNTSLPAISVGEITFGTSVEKEFRRLEIELDSRNFAFQRNSNSVSTTPAKTVDQTLTFITRMALETWVGGPDVLFYQGQSTSDYHWRIRLLASRAIEFSWLDNTDTVRTATSSALPAGWDLNDIVWINIRPLGNFVDFFYMVEEGDPTLVPYPDWNEDEWTAFGSVDMGASFPFKGGVYGDYPIVLFEDTPTAFGDLLYSFIMWPGLWWLTPEDRWVSFNATFYAPDSEGNTWDLVVGNIASPLLRVTYNLDERGWTQLQPTAVYIPKTIQQTFVFPDNVTAKTIKLLIASVRGAGSAPGHALLDWRLLCEPIPTPRYNRYYLPIMLYDNMNTLDGHRISRPGYAWEYLGFLDTLYRAGTAFDFQKPSGFHEPAVVTKVRIEEMEFKEFAPTKGASGFGGICLTVLKEVAT